MARTRGSKVAAFMDSRLRGDYPLEVAMAVVTLVLQCVEWELRERSSMLEPWRWWFGVWRQADDDGVREQGGGGECPSRDLSKVEVQYQIGPLSLKPAASLLKKDMGNLPCSKYQIWKGPIRKKDTDRDKPSQSMPPSYVEPSVAADVYSRR
uniref:Uncharacterized protein n=1 Tax=Oryza brachyantha TaxID=4533 RepID=J3LSP3_ORYBR